MRKLLTAVLAAALVLALGAPAFGDSARSPSDHQAAVTAMRVHGERHGGWRGGDRDDWGHHGYYRHHYGYGYGYYDRYYYDGYYYDGYRRCRWAYYHDPYYFDRYCRGYYGYY